MNKYPSGGFLNQNRNKRGENSPDHIGNLTINGEVLESLANAFNNGADEATILVLGYDFRNRNGQSIKCRVVIPDEDGANQQRGNQRGRSAPPQRGRQQPQRRQQQDLDDEIPFN